MKILWGKRAAISLLGLGLAITFTGCKAMDSAAAGKFATSVTTVKAQADDALNAAAALTRDASVQYAAAQPNLAESNLVETPTADIIAEWDGALGSIETYALNLAALSAPDVAKDFTGAATNLFNQFNQTAANINAGSLGAPSLNAGLATAFTEGAKLIIDAQAQATALKIAAATDAQITNILSLLAAEIGADHRSPGLRSTVYRAWDGKLDALTAPFLSATSQPAKVTIAQQYAGLMAQRAAEDQALAALRRSLLALADAHHALAQGNDASVQTTLTIVLNELQQSRDRYNQFSAQLKK